MLWCHLQSSADVVKDELAGVIRGGLVQRLVFPVVEQKVVAHATSDVCMFDSRHLSHSTIDVEQWAVVTTQVGANLRVDARWASALVAGFLVFAFHAIHICRRSSEVREVSPEIGQVCDSLYFAKYAFLGAADDELALMCRDGAEGTSAETTAMHVHGEAYHVVGGYAFAFVFGMWHPCVGEVEAVVDFLGGHRGKGWIDDYPLVAGLLDESLCLITIALFFDESEVLCMDPRIGEAFFEGMEDDVIRADASGDFFCGGVEGDSLGDGEGSANGGGFAK